MKTRPMLFSGSMVRARRAGRKRQTRRICGDQPGGAWTRALNDDGVILMAQDNGPARMPMRCPYGGIGDRLWVKETWALQPTQYDFEKWVIYRADNEARRVGMAEDENALDTSVLGYDPRQWGGPPVSRWKPSIFMPRWASRDELVITSVRIERLNRITEEDAIAEGAIRNDAPGEEWDGSYLTQRYIDGVEGSQDDEPHGDAREWYRSLWQSINGIESWNANPWVWVIEFSPVSNTCINGCIHRTNARQSSQLRQSLLRNGDDQG